MIVKWFKNNQRTIEILFAVLCGLYFFLWSIRQPFNYAPDEAMRYNLPLYIYKYGHLPLGDDPLVRDANWGFSYAFMPTWLEPLLAAGVMKVTALIFGETGFRMVVAARFISVLAMAGVVYFLLRALDRLFDLRTKWLVTCIIVSIPQFAFIGSYVNQDSLNLLGASMILCAWVYGLKDGWNWKNCLLLSLGISVVVLSYYFGYGWVLGSIIVFFLSYILKPGKNTDIRKMWKLTAFIVVIVLGITSFFLIRNLYLYGDLLGRSSMAAAQKIYGSEEFRTRLSMMGQGMSFSDLLFDKNWWKTSFASFIGCFGYMTVPSPEWVCMLYLVLFALLLTGTVLYGLHAFRTKDKKKILFGLLILIEFLLPVLLSLWYSYSSDYQAQGRYIFSLVPAFAMMCGAGDEYMENHRTVKSIALIVVIGLVSLHVFLRVFLASV